MVLNLCNVCNKNMLINIYKQIRVSVIVSAKLQTPMCKVRMTCLCYFHLLDVPQL